jgi:hypothetical protein
MVFPPTLRSNAGAFPLVRHDCFLQNFLNSSSLIYDNTIRLLISDTESVVKHSERRHDAEDVTCSLLASDKSD